MLILAIALLFVAAYLLYTAAQALMAPIAPARGLGEDEAMSLIFKRDLLIEELRDLEFEAALDKLSEADLARLRARYEAEAVSILDALEAREGVHHARIEADLKRRVEALGLPQPKKPEPKKPEPKKPEPKKPESKKPEPKKGKGKKPGSKKPGSKKPQAKEQAPTPEPQDSAPSAHHCGTCQAEVGPRARFCDECGAATNRCGACQATNRAKATFCGECGEAL